MGYAARVTPDPEKPPIHVIGVDTHEFLVLRAALLDMTIRDKDRYPQHAELAEDLLIRLGRSDDCPQRWGRHARKRRG